ncbi:MAG TPA: insulinase family protein [Polyangiaceae bacterium]|nr:insulinase family protein [Polyangiaceae bacterium]
MFHGPRAGTAFWAAVLCGSLWSGWARAEPAADGAQPAVSPNASSLPAAGLGLQRARLDNGLRVVFRVDHTLPQVAVCSIYDAGSRRDGPISGRAALVHRMLREGGRSTSGADYSRQVEARGGMLDDTLTEDYSRFCTLVPNQEVELALWLEAGRMTEYAFNAPNFEKRVGTLKAEYLDATQGSVHARGEQRLREIAFQRYAAYERVELPTPDDLERLVLADVRDFHREHYRAKNAVLTIAGDFDAFQMLDLVKRHLGNAASGAGALPGAADTAARQTSSRFSVLIEPTAKSSVALYGWVTPDPGHSDHAALLVANSVLGEGDASLLYQQLVDQQHLATGVSAWTTAHAGPELFALRVEGKPDARLDLIERALNDALARVARGALLPESTVEAAKRRVLQRQLERLSSNLGTAQCVGEHELLFGGQPEAALARIERVTAEDIRRAVLAHLPPERRSSIEIYPKEWQDPNQATLPRFHIVSSGENLTSIAKRHGSTADAIAKMNGISEKQPIFPGQKLRVPRGSARKPGTSTASRATTAGATAGPNSSKKKEAIAYQVKKGDSLSSIAARHDISVAALLRANRIDPKKPLKIGQRLAVPIPP